MVANRLLDFKDLIIELPITSKMRSVTDRPERYGAMVVEKYLEMQGVAVDRSACYWRNPAMAQEAIADVMVSDLGRLECLVVSDLTQVTVEVMPGSERLGYVVVMVREKAVELVGFATSVAAGRLEGLMSLDDWWLWLDLIQQGRQALAQVDDLPEQWADPMAQAFLVAKLNRLYRQKEAWEWRYEGEKVLRDERELASADRELASVEREDGVGESRVDLQDLAEMLMERLSGIWDSQ